MLRAQRTHTFNASPFLKAPSEIGNLANAFVPLRGLQTKSIPSVNLPQKLLTKDYRVVCAGSGQFLCKGPLAVALKPQDLHPSTRSSGKASGDVLAPTLHKWLPLHFTSSNLMLPSHQGLGSSRLNIEYLLGEGLGSPELASA